MTIKFNTMLFLLLLITPLAIHGQPKKMAKVRGAILSEISGITPYSFEKGFFWVHNDSGDKANIYLIDSLASLQVTVRLEGINAVDCEDIARVIIDGKSYLLLADIGNNSNNREVLHIYMLPEPKVDFKSKEVNIEADRIKTIAIKYADKRRDAEAIFVDQQQQEVYIVSKRDFKSTVFSFPIASIDNNELIILEPKLTLPFNFVTSADMSLDGRNIVIKNLTNVYMWERDLLEPILKTLAKPYRQIPYEIEPQGEAICFDVNRRYFYTISERPLGLDSYLYQYIY